MTLMSFASVWEVIFAPSPRLGRLPESAPFGILGKCGCSANESLEMWTESPCSSTGVFVIDGLSMGISQKQYTPHPDDSGILGSTSKFGWFGEWILVLEQGREGGEALITVLMTSDYLEKLRFYSHHWRISFFRPNNSIMIWRRINHKATWPCIMSVERLLPLEPHTWLWR